MEPKLSQPKLLPDDCPTCGGGGDNDPSGDRGSNPLCPDCGGTGKRKTIPYTCTDCGSVAQSGELPKPPALAIYPLPKGWKLRRNDGLLCDECSVLF